MKKVVISGYYGFDNLGDEVILAALINNLRQLKQKVHITVLSNNPAATAQNYQVQAIERWPLANVKQALKGCELFITGGGSLLQDRTSIKTIPYYLTIMGMARRRGAKTALFACGMGPVNRWWLQKGCQKSLQKADFISVRDEESKQLLIKMGLRKEISLIPDPAFTLAGQKPTLNYDLLRQEGLRKQKPLILLAPRNQVGQAADPSFWVEVIKQIKAQKEVQFLLWPLHQQEDYQLCQAIAAHSKEDLIKKPLTPQNILSCFRGVDLVIGVRYHALLLAAVAGRALLGIAYDPKVKSLLKSLNLLHDLDLSKVDAATIAWRALKCLQQKEKVEQIVKQQTKELKLEALKGFELLAKLL